MYTATDREMAQKTAKKQMGISLLAVLAGVLAFVLGLIVRSKIVGLSGLILGLWIAYFLYALRAKPCLQYAGFLRDMSVGLSRSDRGAFVRAGDRARVSEEGVFICDFVIRDESGERLFYWDEAKPLPPLAPDTPVALTAYGRYVTGFEIG